MSQLKKEILDLLKDGEKSSSKISSFINRDYYFCLKLLKELESEKKIKRIELNRFTFWMLQNSNKQQIKGEVK